MTEKYAYCSTVQRTFVHDCRCREVPPKRGTFFRLQVYERVGILLVEVYERGVKSVIWVCERTHRANR